MGRFQDANQDRAPERDASRLGTQIGGPGESLGLGRSSRREGVMLVLKSFATPMVWVLLLLALGLLLTRRSRRRDPKPRAALRVGRLLLLLGIVLLVAFSSKPMASFLTYPLECRYQMPSAQALSGLDVVIVLGGGLYPAGHLRQEAELSHHAYVRFYRGVQVFKENRAGLLAFCGGSLRPGAESEAETMKAMALRLGVPEDRILTEATSRNTFENIANLARLLPAGQGRRIGLVTSALHMWRSHRVTSGRFPNDTIVPIPVCFTYDPTGWSQESFVPSSGNLEQSTIALHEWIGLLWYAVRHQ
jgi:uncharacterized SAM-binding protein YcdF (DUF218 family)